MLPSQVKPRGGGGKVQTSTWTSKLAVPSVTEQEAQTLVDSTLPEEVPIFPEGFEYIQAPQMAGDLSIQQSIVMLQDTSLVYVVGLRDFLTTADIVAGRDSRPVELYMFVALTFLVVCFSASRLVNRLRRRYAL